MPVVFDCVILWFLGEAQPQVEKYDFLTISIKNNVSNCQKVRSMPSHEVECQKELLSFQLSKSHKMSDVCQCPKTSYFSQHPMSLQVNIKVVELLVEPFEKLQPLASSSVMCQILYPAS